MYIPCWNCGEDIWIETQTECRHCGERSKRCVDCVHYIPGTSMCTALDVPINETDAGTPTSLSQSYRCADYTQSPDAAQKALARKGKPRATDEPAAAAAPTAPRPRPAARPRAKAPEARRPRRPQVIAHRGCSADAPENTLVAIGKAAEMGCDAIEIDVHITSDAVPAVIHDSTVDRTTDGAGAVAEMTFDALRALDAGSWFRAEFAGERVPSLGEALDAAGRAFVGVHVKCHENQSNRAEQAIVDAIREAGAVDRVWITHHTRHGLHRFRRFEDQLRLCWLPRDGGRDEEYIDDAFYMGYRMIQPTFRVVTPEFVEYAHQKRLWINVFWADDEELMRRLTGMGVNGILTNKPALLQQVVGAGPRASSSGDSQ